MALPPPSLHIPFPKRTPLVPLTRITDLRINGRRAPKRVCAIESTANLTSPPPEVTWQIVIGALAGVSPFVVAGIEFGKRIAAQKRCEICRGSGLVHMEDGRYVRCSGCGGFLPWQSWKRFFTG